MCMASGVTDMKSRKVWCAVAACGTAVLPRFVRERLQTFARAMGDCACDLNVHGLLADAGFRLRRAAAPGMSGPCTCVRRLQHLEGRQSQPPRSVQPTVRRIP